MQRCARLGGVRAHHVDGALAQRRDDSLARPGEDPGLLGGYLRDGVAEDGGVLEVDGQDHRDVLAGDHVGGVEAAAEANFEHLPVAARLRAGEPAEQGDQLEVRPALGRLVVEERPGEPRECRVVQRLAVDAHALARLVYVGRGQQQGVRAGGAQDRLDHRGGRALALGAGDVDRAALLGPAGAVEVVTDVGDAEALRFARVAGALEAAAAQQAAHRLDVGLD